MDVGDFGLAGLVLGFLLVTAGVLDEGLEQDVQQHLALAEAGAAVAGQVDLLAA